MSSGDLRPRPGGLKVEVAFPEGARVPALAHLLVGHREVEYRVRELRVERDRALQLGDRAARVPTFEERITEVVVRLGLPLVERDGLAIEGDGLLPWGLPPPMAEACEYRS